MQIYLFKGKTGKWAFLPSPFALNPEVLAIVVSIKGCVLWVAVSKAGVPDMYTSSFHQQPGVNHRESMKLALASFPNI